MSDSQKSPVDARRLGWLLVFAVVYADIGTSIFYVPGILYLSIGRLATLAQIITTGVFISIAMKYVEICERCPDGGGVVSICREAFSSWTFLPLAGGALITVDYFLTSAISGVSGVYYLASLMPAAKPWVVPITLALLVVLAVLNIVGLRESAAVSAVFSVAKVGVSFLLVGCALAVIGARGEWSDLFSSVVHPGVPITGTGLLIGYANTWLAYSGLETLSQVSAAMKPPIRRTASMAMWLTVAVIAIISPIITATALHLVPDSMKSADPESLIGALGLIAGGPTLQLLTVITASTLLFMACNTAMVGNYHVNVRLADLGFIPEALRRKHPRFGTPYISILLSALVPILILLFTRGSIAALGDLYAFGLLGTLTISSAAVDRLRWRDGQRGVRFWSGLVTTLLLVLAWSINCFHKPAALLFGGAISGLILAYGYFNRKNAEARAAIEFRRAEALAADRPESEAVLTLEEATEAAALAAAHTLVSLRFLNTRLLDEVVGAMKGKGERSAYLVCVDETPGLFTPADTAPSPEARRVLSQASAYLKERGLEAIPIWRIAEDAGSAVAAAAWKLKVTTVYVGASKRNFLWRLIRGRVLKRLSARLPEDCSLVIIG